MNRTEYTSLGETLYTTTLPNGLAIYVITKPGYSKKFAVFATNYGGVNRSFLLDGKRVDTPAGVAHYLEHKMFDTPEGDALLKLSATGANPNAFTSETMTAYHFECTEQFEENLKTLLSFVSVPYFTDESVDKERGIIAQEILMCEDNADYILYMNLMRLLYADGPLRDSVAGTVESIEDITPQVLYDCHKAFYHPCNMALCVVGDVSPDEVERIALEILPAETAVPPGKIYDMTDTLEPAGLYAEVTMEVAATEVLSGMKLAAPPEGVQGMRERLTAYLALRCLCGSSSPLYLRLYSEGLLNDTFGASIDYAAGQGVLSLGGESRDFVAVLEAIYAEIESIAKNGIDPVLFERQRKAATGSRIRALNNFRSLAVSMVEASFGGMNPLEAAEVLETITCEETSDWLRTHVAGRPMAISLMKPREVT